MIRIRNFTPFLGQKSLKIRGMNGIRLLLNQIVNAFLLLLVNSVAVGSDSTLSGFGGYLSIFEALSDAFLLVKGEGRLNLVHHSFVFSHDLEGLLDVAL